MLLILEQIVERPQRKQITPVAVVESSRRPICMGAAMVDIFKRQLLVWLELELEKIVDDQDDRIMRMVSDPLNRLDFMD